MTYSYLLGKILNFTLINPTSCAVVDDDSQCRELLSGSISSLGFIVSEFSSAEDFLTVYRQFRFDFLMLTWDVGKMSCSELVSELKEIGKPFPKFVVICDGNQSVSMHFSIRPNDFLFKPFGIGNLVSVIGSAIGE